MTRLILVTCAVLAAGAGCKSKPSLAERDAEVVARHRAAVEKVLDAVVAIGNKPLGPVTGSFTKPVEDPVEWLPADPQVIAAWRGGKRLDYTWFSGGGSAPTEPGILAGELENPDRVEKMLTEYETTKQVLLIKTREDKKPVRDGDKFVAGHITADLYLFALDGTALGSTHIDVSNSNSVLFEQSKHGDDAQSMLETDLNTHARDALLAALGRH